MSLSTTDSSHTIFTIFKHLWWRVEFFEFSTLKVYGDLDGQIQSPLSKKRLIQTLNKP